MRIKKPFWIGLTLVFGVQPAQAETLYEWTEPSVSYEASRIVETGPRRMQMREYHAPGKQRFEMNAQGQNTVMIHRHDTGESWMLMPRMNMYMETSAAQVAQQSGSGVEVMERSRVGSETVNGYETTKYRAVFREPRGGKTEGWFWITDEHGIPIKMDMETGGQRVHMELTDLEIGPQPASLFEVPEGYRQMPGGMAGMGAMGGMPGGGQSSSMGGSGQSYMDRLAERRAQQQQEKQARLARQEQERQALAQLSVDYLKDGCWFDREAQIKVHADGSYDVGTHAGRGYAMSRAGDSIQDFRDRYEGLVSKTPNRFVVRSRGREWAYERRPCVTVGGHSIAGPGKSQESSDQGTMDKARDTINNATDKIRKGIGSFFD